MIPNHFLAVARNQHPMPAAVQRAAHARATQAGRGGEEILVALARRADLAAEVDQLLGRTSSARVFRTWVMNPRRTPEEKRSILQREKRPTILAALAKDPETPAELLELLRGRMTERIASALLHNRNAPNDLLVEAALALEPGTVDGPYVQHGEERIRLTPTIHEELGRVCGKRVATLLVTSAHLTSATRWRLLQEAILPLAQEGAPAERTYRCSPGSPLWRHDQRQDLLHQVVETCLTQNLLTRAHAQLVLEALESASSSSRGEYRRGTVLDQLRRYVSERSEGEIELGEDALVSRARSATGEELDQVLQGLYAMGRSWVHERDALFERVAAAVRENPAMTSERLLEYAGNLDPATARYHLAPRLRKGRPEDLELLLTLFDRGVVASDVVVTAGRSNPDLLPDLLDGLNRPDAPADSRGRHRRPSRWAVVGELLDADLVPLAWMLDLDSQALERILDDPRAEDLYVRALLEGLGDEPSVWEIFTETSTHPGTLRERIWAARTL